MAADAVPLRHDQHSARRRFGRPLRPLRSGGGTTAGLAMIVVATTVSGREDALQPVQGGALLEEAAEGRVSPTVNGQACASIEDEEATASTCPPQDSSGPLRRVEGFAATASRPGSNPKRSATSHGCRGPDSCEGEGLRRSLNSYTA